MRISSSIIAAAFAVSALASPISLQQRQDANTTIVATPPGDNSTVVTAPTPPTDNSTTVDAQPALNDTQILQFALTLEHLEANFYNSSISRFSDEDFKKAGLNSTARDQIYAIGLDEAAHVKFLTTALGNASAVSPCSYNFNTTVTDVKTFLATSQILEGVGTSAYLGAAGLVNSKAYLGAAASILTVEARHSSIINAAVAASLNKSLNAAPSAFDTPLNATQVFSLAAAFITSCPENSTLPFTAFPAATVVPASTISLEASSSNETDSSSSAGNTFNIAYNSTAVLPQTQDGQNTTNSTLYVAVVSGVTPPTFYPLGSNNSFTIPANVTGQVYAIVTSSNSSVTDANTVAGPAVYVIPAPLVKAPTVESTNSSSSSAVSSSTSASEGAASSTAEGAASSTSSVASGAASSGGSSATGTAASSTATPAPTGTGAAALLSAASAAGFTQ